ncbi:MAG: hypothetical protein AAF527_06880, partial [Pseudomonadota bacterium]
MADTDHRHNGTGERPARPTAREAIWRRAATLIAAGLISVAPSVAAASQERLDPVGALIQSRDTAPSIETIDPAAPQPSNAPTLTAPTTIKTDATTPPAFPVAEPSLSDVAVLSDADAARYRKIFSAQDRGDWRSADTFVRALESDVLMGHVKYQRFMHPTKYRSTYSELKNWMERYADHPGAARVYRLAMKRRPSNYRAPRRPEKRAWRAGEPSAQSPA